MIIPLGMATVALHRVPWVSIGIVLFCMAVFAFSQPMLRQSEEAGEQLVEVVNYWYDHPYLELDPTLRDAFVPEAVQRQVALLADELEGASEDGADEGGGEAELHAMFGIDRPTLPDQETLDAEQKHLNEMSSAVLSAISSQGLGKWGLVPSKGALQRGWFGHMFLHADFWHLFFNLLLFGAVALLLEDLWGRVLFPLFFIVGGLAGGIGHFLADTGSMVPLVGASGAIAACLGAFAVRCAREEVRFLIFPAYLWGKIVHVLTMPAWLWGTLFFGLELLTFQLVGTKSGVSNMAHIGGFAFGGGLAMLLRYSGIEEKFIAPAVEKKREGWFEHEGVALAKAALENGQRGEARALYNTVISDDPNNVEARLGLARLAAQDRDNKTVTFHVERLAATRVAVGDVDTVAEAFDELWGHVNVASLRPPIAFGVAEALKDRPNSHAVDLFEHLASGDGQLGERSRVFLEEIRARDARMAPVAPELALDLLPEPEPYGGLMVDEPVPDPYGGLELVDEPVPDPYGGLELVDELEPDPYGGLEPLDDEP